MFRSLWALSRLITQARWTIAYLRSISWCFASNFISISHILWIYRSIVGLFRGSSIFWFIWDIFSQLWEDEIWFTIERRDYLYLELCHGESRLVYQQGVCPLSLSYLARDSIGSDKGMGSISLPVGYLMSSECDEWARMAWWLVRPTQDVWVIGRSPYLQLCLCDDSGWRRGIRLNHHVSYLDVHT